MKNSAIIYEGPSMLDGSPIIVAISGFAEASDNTKTGSMLQMWIMPRDVSPKDAIKTGEDASVCGDCKRRPSVARSVGKRPCYVKTWQAPHSVWSAIQRDTVPVATAEHMAIAAFRKLRLGAWGDPAAVPQDVLEAWASNATDVTGYCHQWQHERFKWLRRWCMASADSPEEQDQARAKGWRSFVVLEPDQTATGKSVNCPASAEAGKRTTCADCRACGGLSSKAKADMFIMEHR